MKQVFFYTLLIIYSIYNGALAQEINLKILDGKIEVSKDTHLLNIFHSELTHDSIVFATYGSIEVELTNRTKKNVIFTNFPTILFSNLFTGNCNFYYSNYDSVYLSQNSDVCFSISDNSNNLTFSQITGTDACIFADFPNDSAIYTFQEFSDSLIVDNWSFAADVSNRSFFQKEGIRTIIKLGPNSSFSWKIFFKNCELRSFNSIIANKEYIFKLYYHQGNNILLPKTFPFEDYELFKGVLVSNDVPIIFLD